MNKNVNKLGRKHRILFLIIIFCVFSLTLGQFIPIYFVDANLRSYYYLSIFIILLITIIITIFRIVYNPEEYGIFSATLISLLIGFITFIIFGLWTLVLLLRDWNETGAYYVKKSNPNIKIIGRYIDMGGDEPRNYHIVLTRPLVFFIKMETSIDTTLINKTEWSIVR